jgi:hypothetical protein
MEPLPQSSACIGARLTAVRRHLPEIPLTDTAALETLLPNRGQQVHPEHRLTEREGESREAHARRRRKRAARDTLQGPSARCDLAYGGRR